MAEYEDVDGVLLVVTVMMKKIKQRVEAKGFEVVYFGGFCCLFLGQSLIA